jgi:hypothetical protein
MSTYYMSYNIVNLEQNLFYIAGGAQLCVLGLSLTILDVYACAVQLFLQYKIHETGESHPIFCR